MDARYRIRAVTPADVPVVVRHRVLMFADMGEQPLETAAAIEARTRAQLAPLIASGAYVGWLVESDEPVRGITAEGFGAVVASAGTIAAGLGIIERPRVARHSNPDGAPEAYVLNVYTERDHRRRGLALELMHTVIAWCRARGIGRIALHASAAGRPVYERLGFTPTNEMSLSIGP